MHRRQPYCRGPPMASELISILISTYDRSHCLDELLNRLTTMFADEVLEILVFDDASSDDTPMVCAKYAGKIRRFCSERNIGQIPGRTRLIREARGEYLAFLDDDSCFVDRDALRLIRQAFRDYPQCGVIAANISSRTSMSGVFPRDASPMLAPDFTGCGVVIKARAIRGIGGGYPDFLA